MRLRILGGIVLLCGVFLLGALIFSSLGREEPASASTSVAAGLPPGMELRRDSASPNGEEFQAAAQPQKGVGVSLDVTDSDLVKLVAAVAPDYIVQSPGLRFLEDGGIELSGKVAVRKVAALASSEATGTLTALVTLLPEEMDIRTVIALSPDGSGGIDASLREVIAQGISLPVGVFERPVCDAVEGALANALSAAGASVTELSVSEGVLHIAGTVLGE